MGGEAEFGAVEARLRQILRPFEASYVVSGGGPEGAYSLDLPPDAQHPGGWLFGAVHRRKRYVSYYLGPVYTEPDLAASISPALRKRMQGKSCFNFTSIDEGLLGELEALTRTGFERYRSRGNVVGRAG